MDRFTKGLLFVGMVIIAITIYASVVNAQTPPPISTITDLPDTVYSLEVAIPFEVASSIPWDQGGGVGFYYRIPGGGGWHYIPEISGAYEEALIRWTAPYDDMTYELSTQVTDNAGNDELYPNEQPEPQAKATVYVCSSCLPVDDCPPMSNLDLVTELAERGFQMEADEPKLSWHWAHSDSGTAPIKYEAEWDVGGSIAFLDSIAVGDTTFAEVDLPYTWGTYQLLRVRGVDAGNRAGPWSIWSERWEDAGPPGQPEQPQGTLKMVK